MFMQNGVLCEPPPVEFTCDEDVTEHVQALWARGLTGKSLRVSQERKKVEYAKKTGPKLWDQYDIEAQLGQGSFGICHAGVHRATRTPCAVKLLEIKTLSEEYLENKVQNDGYSTLLELHDCLKIPHPNVVRYFDILMGSATIFVVMEPLLGPELFDYIAEEAPLTEVFCCDVTRQALAALQHIHHVGIIHRDIKLENLRFRSESPDSPLVLLDFGLMCPADSDKKKLPVGSMMYVAPEVFSGWYGTKADLWSLGVALYVMLSGDSPFGDNSYLLEHHGFEALHEARQGIALKNIFATPVLQNAPRLAVELLRRLLEENPEHRFDAGTALQHHWFSCTLSNGSPKRPSSPTKSTRCLIDVEKHAYVDACRRSKEFPYINDFNAGPITMGQATGFLSFTYPLSLVVMTATLVTAGLLVQIARSRN